VAPKLGSSNERRQAHSKVVNSIPGFGQY
jgi:hypothetical protein